MTWLDLAFGALWIAAVAQTLFVVFYMTVRWWRHFVGRALFSKSFALMLLLQLSLVNHYYDYAWELQVSALLTCLVAVAIVFQLGALLWQQHLDRDARR